MYEHQCCKLQYVYQLKDYGFSAAAFNRLLHYFHVQYNIAGCWLLYQDYAGKDYTISRTYQFGDDAASMHTCWTQKGRLFLYEFLKDVGIVPKAEEIADDCVTDEYIEYELADDDSNEIVA